MSGVYGAAIGIDLGTTYSVVAICKKGQVRVIQDEADARVVPSVVAFAKGRKYVGDAAKDMPASTRVYDAKRIIGRSFDDPVVQRNLQRWPFKVVNHGGSPRYEMTDGERTERLSPEEISSMVLAHLKQAAESFLEAKVEKAVITVPAYFSERQREATKKAGRIAGLDVIGIVNEPTAAAMAYGLHKRSSKKTVFVYDLGGGTFDVSILTIDGGEFQVVASDGNSNLGGRDFDERLVDYIVQDLNKKNLDVTGYAQVLDDIRVQSELAKRKLSSLHQVSIAVFLPKEVDVGYKTTISRALFEDLCADLFESTISVCRAMLAEAKAKEIVIDDVLLVGGSTRMPKVRTLLQGLFPGKDLMRSINADEAVASGAALLGATLGGDRYLPNVSLREVTALSLGKSVIGDRFEVLIPRNTPIPCKRTKTFSTAFDGQIYVNSKIYQGERPLCRDNIFLNKEYTITVPSRPAGKVKLETTFELDASGLLTVTCVERSQGTRQVVTIHNSDTEVTDEEIQRMVSRAQRYKERDEEEKARIEEDLKKGQFLV